MSTVPREKVSDMTYGKWCITNLYDEKVVSNLYVHAKIIHGNALSCFDLANGMTFNCHKTVSDNWAIATYIATVYITVCFTITCLILYTYYAKPMVSLVRHLVEDHGKEILLRIRYANDRIIRTINELQYVCTYIYM